MKEDPCSAFSLSLSLSLVIAGCADPDNPKTKGDDDDDDGPISDILTPRYTVDECPDATCDVTIRVLAEEMETCFGWDPETYPGVGWPPSAPDELDLDCQPEIDLYCFFELGTTSVVSELDGSCNCIGWEDTDDDCCIPLELGQEYAWWAGVTYEFFAGFSSCGFTVQQDLTCELDEPPDWDTCGLLEGWAIAPGADYVLTVNPNLSYVDISCPLGNESFALAGGGSAATGPARFMTGLVWAAPGSLGSHDLTGWYWSFDAPITLDLNSGAFLVDHDDNPVFTGSGYDGTQGYTIRATISEDASGNFYTDTWELDFEQTALSWNVEVHLEGDIEEIE